MHEYVKRPSSKQSVGASQRKKEALSAELSNSAMCAAIRASAAPKTATDTVQRISIGLHVPDVGTVMVDTKDPKYRERILNWIVFSAENQIGELQRFAKELSAIPESEYYKIAADALNNKMIAAMEEITGDAGKYPYGGFLSKKSSSNRAPDGSPLVEDFGIAVRGGKKYKPGLNCWGAILYAAFKAGFIDKATCLRLDKKGNDDVNVSMLNNPYAVLMLTEQELVNTPFPRGDIISTSSALSFENFPGDHVFLSLGGVGKDTAVIEFDSRTRGRTTLGDILSRHRSAPQIADDAIIKYPAPPKSAGGYYLLYLYHPIWLDH